MIADQQFLDQIHEIQDKIFRISKRILISEEEAQDATQEVIIKLWNLGIEKRNGFKSMEAYSISMAKNYCFDRLKSKQAQSLSFKDSIEVPTTVSTLNKIEASDDLNWLMHLIDQLPEKERIIIQLREIEHLSFCQIASILEIPEPTVRVYLSRTRKKLRNQYLKIQNHGLQ